jgi:hypothetical protein
MMKIGLAALVAVGRMLSGCARRGRPLTDTSAAPWQVYHFGLSCREAGLTN